MTRPVCVALVAGALLGLAGAAPALAAGSGGGSMPSASAPAYDPAADYVKAVAALNDGRFKDAERSLERVTDAAPKYAEAWRLLGQANAGQSDWKGARKAYERAVKLEPDSVAAHGGLGLALAGLEDPRAQGELDWLKARTASCGGTCAEAEALKTATEAIEQAIAGAAPAAAARPMLFAGPASGDAAYLSAVALINERRYDEALAELDAAQAAFGPHPDILTYQGYAWRRKGALDRAEAYYRQALAVAPDHRGATEYYGELKVERGDLAGARVMLARLDRICAFGCAEAEELRRWIDAGHAPQP